VLQSLDVVAGERVVMEYRSAAVDDIPWLTEAFVAAMRTIASQAGERPVQLAVLKAKTAARRFYERLGCRKLSTSRHHDHFEWPTSAFLSRS
jgi:hypothetical protein